MQKFTRPLTREIELAGERLAVTLSAEGLSVRPVGSRKPPLEAGWAEIVRSLTARGTGTGPTPEELKAAVEALKKGGSAKSASSPSGSAPARAAPAPGAQPAGTATMADLLSRLQKWLAKHRRHYLDGLLPGAGPAELEALQNRVGVPLPEPLKALLSGHNGQSDQTFSRLVQDWCLMSTDQIAAAKQELDAGATDNASWNRAWIPFLDNDAGDYVCVDSSRPEAPVREFWQDKTEHPVVAPSLAAWLEDIVSAMERGEYHEDPERGTFLRQ